MPLNCSNRAYCLWLSLGALEGPPSHGAKTTFGVRRYEDNPHENSFASDDEVASHVTWRAAPDSIAT